MNCEHINVYCDGFHHSSCFTHFHNLLSLPRESVRLGEYNTETKDDCIVNENVLECADPAIDVPVEETIVHEDYRPDSRNNHHDIALIRLAHDVNFTRFIRPICLPKNSLNSGLSVGYRLTVSGWGQTDICKQFFWAFFN